MLPARKRALVLGGGADEGEGGLLSVRGCLCNLPDFTVPRTRTGPCVRCGCFGQLGEIASIKIFTLHLGLSLIPPGRCCILIITIRVAMRCLLIPLLYFLAVSASMVSLSPPGLGRSPMATCCLDAPGPCLNFGSANPQGPEPTHTHKPKMLCTNRRARAAWTVGHGMPRITAEWNHTFLPFLPPFVPSSRGGEIG